MSKSAVFNGEKAIRGGIPLVFPQFGRPSEALAQHGFARNSIWKKLGDCQSESSGGVSVTFVLSDNERTRSLFPYSFKVYYKVHLKTDGLCLTFTVENPPEAESAFQCHTLIHTYLAINTESTVVKGFGGLSFKDHLDGLIEKQNEGSENDITCEIDRRYPAYKGEVTVAGASKQVIIDTSGTLNGKEYPVDVVFWNAWVDKCKATSDLDDDAYKHYVCIEPGMVSDWATVAPGQTLELSKTMTVKR